MGTQKIAITMPKDLVTTINEISKQKDSLEANLFLRFSKKKLYQKKRSRSEMHMTEFFQMNPSKRTA